MTTYIKTIEGKGRCVFAGRDFEEGDLILENHVITYPFLDDHKLLEYSMAWTDDEDALALGYINLLNHSETPNCKIVDDIDAKIKRLYASSPITRDAELTIRYKCQLWFGVAE